MICVIVWKRSRRWFLPVTSVDSKESPVNALNKMCIRDSTNDQEGTIMLSKKRIDALKGWDMVVAAEESGDVLDGCLLYTSRCV